MTSTHLDFDPLEGLATVFKGLSEPTRVAIMVLLLLQDEMCVCDIERVLGVTQSRSSRHLRYLANAGLVSAKRVGPWIHYRIASNLDPVRTAVVETLRTTLADPSTKQLRARLSQWRRTTGTAGTCAASVKSSNGAKRREVTHV